jgi:hypothetical protein
MFRSIIFTSLGFLLALAAAAQVDTTKSPYGHYFFEGEEVVFEFDRRQYAKAVRAADNADIDFGDIDVTKVALSGNFNGWSWEGWAMQKVDAYRYRLRKKVADLKGEPNWQFKFVINGAYWTQPKVPQQGALIRYDLKNPDKATKPDEQGNVLFQLKGYAASKKVIVCGNFNHWDEQALEMKKTATGWELRLTLKPGTYEYKFIADGEWMHDPANPNKKHNEHSTFNSLLYVTTPVRFTLPGHTDAQRVVLSGSFNLWNETALPMTRTSAGWTLEVPLTGGKHHYKFIADGNWLLDPNNKRTETTWDGYVNSVVIVR